MSHRLSVPTLAAILLLPTATSVLAQDALRLPKVLGSHMVLQRDKPILVWGWAKVGQRVSVQFAKMKETATAGADGRWELQFPAQKANRKPNSLIVRSGGDEIRLTDVLVGEVWLCSGQSNMAWQMAKTQRQKQEIPKAKHPHLRLLAFGGKNAAWVACTPITVKQFSGVGYHFGRALMQKLKVPIGLIRSAVGGTKIEPWTPRIGAESFDSLRKQASAGDGKLFTRLIKPLAPMTMRGAIWYQGESNVIQGDTAIYTDRQAALVAGWRKVFRQDDLSFYYVQLAPCTYARNYGGRNKKLTGESLPLFWEAQTNCMRVIKNSGMVVVTDITGNVRDIHPRNKRDVGERLARWALAKNYGRKAVCSGPLYQAMGVKGSAITLSFDHVGGGLKSLDKKSLTEFTIAGADHKFVPAVARIQGDTVVVKSRAVANPKAVRFGWHEAAVPNLGNKAGLPASPFRTDDW